MIGVKEVGDYNVDFAGEAWDGEHKYEMIIISQFDGNTELKRKTVYFDGDMKEAELFLFREKNIDKTFPLLKDNQRINDFKQLKQIF